MSKLAERIQKASRTQAAPFGFAAAAAKAQELTLLVVARLASGDAGKAEEAAKKGADAVLIDGLKADKLKSVRGKLPDAALGVSTGGASRQDVTALRDAGADFVLLETDDAAGEALLADKIGFVMAADAGTDDTRLRVLGEMGLEALVMPPLEGPFTVGRLIELRRVAMLTRTPLLIPVAADADAGLLQALRECGAAGVLVEGAGKIEALKQTIASLPARGKRKDDGGSSAVLPAQPASGHDHDDYDDYDD